MLYMDQKLTVTTNTERRAIRVRFEPQPDPADTVTLSLTVQEARDLAFSLLWHAFGLEQKLDNPCPVVSGPASEYDAYAPPEVKPKPGHGKRREG